MKKIILPVIVILQMVTVCSSPSEDIQADSANTQLFSMAQLYPTEKPPMSDTKKFIITGTIDTVIFKEGVFRVITTDGDKVAMMFDPTHMAPSETTRLSLVLHNGNKITCTSTKSDSNIYEMLAAEITERELTN